MQRELPRRMKADFILKTNKEGVVLSDGNNEDIAEHNYRYMARYVAIKLKKKYCSSI